MERSSGEVDTGSVQTSVLETLQQDWVLQKTFTCTHIYIFVGIHKLGKVFFKGLCGPAMKLDA